MIVKVILISTLYVLAARMMFFQAKLLKKKTKQIGHNLLPT